MQTINIDGLILTQSMIDELKKWYEDSIENDPERFIGYMNDIQHTLVRLMCDNDPDSMMAEIKESLSEILIMSESLKRLIPERK